MMPDYKMGVLRMRGFRALVAASLLGVGGLVTVVAPQEASAATTATFSTPGSFTYQVAAGVTSIAVDTLGASGSTPASGFGPSGLGGEARATIPVTGCETLTVYVGDLYHGPFGGGGNASGIFGATANQEVVAGAGGAGGGIASDGSAGGAGGAGGGANGGNGTNGANGGGGGGGGAMGATSGVPGLGTPPGTNGNATTGGTGANGGGGGGGAGGGVAAGGGGGGGGAANEGGGGGGGGSGIGPAGTTFLPGVHSGTGVVTIAAATAPGTGCGLVFTGIAPTRVCDTRPPAVSGITDACTNKTLAAGVPLVVPLPANAVPPNAGAVVANVTVTGPSDPGFVAVFPTGQAAPATANLNFAAGQTVGNMVTVATGVSGGGRAITVMAPASVRAADVVIDVEGYDAAPGGTPAGGFHPLTSARVADTRCALSPPPSFCGAEGVPPVNHGAGRIGPAGQDTVTVTGVGGVPAAGVAAVVVNLAAVAPTAPGYVTVAPGGTIPAGGPAASSSINFVAGEVLSNKVIVPVSSSGTISVYNAAGNTDVAIDVDGWYSNASGPAGATLTPVSPVRLADTRCAARPLPSFCAGENLPAVNAADSPPAGGSSITVGVGGTGSVPASISAAVLNVVDVAPSAGNFLTVYPTGGAVPPSADVNWVPANTYNIVPNAVYAATSTTGAVNILNGAVQTTRTDIVADLFGYYTPPAGGSAAVAHPSPGVVPGGSGDR